MFQKHVMMVSISYINVSEVCLYYLFLNFYDSVPVFDFQDFEPEDKNNPGDCTKS